MAVQEDARTAARRIVEEVLAGHGSRTAGESARDADRGNGAAPATRDQVAEEAPVVVEGDDVIVDLTEPDPVVAAEPEPSAERLRARALVAEVLETHEARQAEAEARARAEAEAAVARAREEEAERRAAEAQAEAEARAAAEAEERERTLAEERERALWAEADREVASETVQMPREEEAAARAADRTSPLDVAELAAAGRTEPDDPAAEAGALDDGGDPERTAVLRAPGDRVAAADPGETQVVAAPEGGATAVAAPAEEAHAAEGLESPSAPVLEAIVDPGDVVEPPRTGRWLLASILGAVTLAILFPLAINALMDLVAMS